MVNYISVNWQALEHRYVVFCFIFFDDKEGKEYSSEELKLSNPPFVLNGFQIKILDNLIELLFRLFFVKKTNVESADDIVIEKNIHKKHPDCKKVRENGSIMLASINRIQHVSNNFHFKMFMLKFGFT